MTNYSGSESYDFELYEYINGGTAAEELPFDYSTYTTETKSNAAKKRAPKNRKRPIMLREFLVSFILVAVLCCGSGVLLSKRVEIDDYASKINDLNDSIELELSDNIRLYSELEAMFTKREVESYAENVLGMVKPDANNTISVKISDSDRVVIAGGKNSSSKATNQQKKVLAPDTVYSGDNSAVVWAEG